MTKIKLFTIVCAYLISLTTFASTTLKLDKQTIETINDLISVATSKCDFEKSTQYYFEQTKFYSYNIIDDQEVVQEQNYSEAMSEFKTAMDACYVTLAKESTISELIEISNYGNEATFKSEAIHYLKTTDGRFFASHNKGKTLFSVIDGKIKIKETHYFGLSFKEIEKVP